MTSPNVSPKNHHVHTNTAAGNNTIARWRVLGVNPGCEFPAGGGGADPDESRGAVSRCVQPRGRQPGETPNPAVFDV